MKASEVGLPTFEASVSCGAWCQGGSVNMQPTSCAEYEEAEFVWVRGDVAGTELERLRSRLAEAEAEIARADYATRRAVERLAEAEALLTKSESWLHFWMADETMVPAGLMKEWNETVAFVQKLRAFLGEKP